MPGDNQLNGAVNIAGLSTNRNGKVGKKDLEDLYRFNVSGRSSLDLSLSKISKKARVGVELYKLKRPFDEVASSVGNFDFSKISASDVSANFELIRSNRARSPRGTSIALNPLDSGDYVIRVRQSKKDSKYRLSMNGTLLVEEPPILPGDPIPSPSPEPTPEPTPEPPPINPAEDGNSLATARSLDFPFTPQGGFINDSDTQDFYKFSVPGTGSGDYKFDLSGLAADANVEILNSDGVAIKSAITTGKQAESILLPLNEGSYYARVFQGVGGAASNYGLSMALLTDNATGTLIDGPSTATLLVPTPNLGVVTSNYVLDGAKSSTEDLFKIEVKQRSFLNLELKGKDGSSLAGNLDIELFEVDGFERATTPAPTIFSSARPGNSAELFGGTLKPLPVGSYYYIRVKPTGTGEGSEYSLSMSLNDKKDVPTITRDINYGRRPILDENDNVVGFENLSSDAALLTNVGNLAYFSAKDGTDTALWKTDGTLKGTQKIKTFAGGGALSGFTAAGTAGQRFLYFMGNDGVNGLELWKSDGTTAGTNMVKDLRPGSEDSLSTTTSKLIAAGDRLYFKANNGSAGPGKSQFYRTNVTGTDIERVPGKLGALFIDVDNIAFYNDTLFFSAESDSGTTSGKTDLWTISNASGANAGDATEQKLRTASGNANPNGFVQAANGNLYAAASLTGTTPSLVRINNTGSSYTATEIPSASSLNSPKNFLAVGDTLYFSGNTSTNGTELWKLDTTNGTATSDTAMLLDIDPASGLTGSAPSDLVKVDTSVYFFATKGGIRGLWKATGSVTTQINIADGTELGANPSELIAIGTDLYFTADSSTKGRELWSYSTIAPSSPMKLRDINFGAASSSPGRLTDIGGTLYFIADNGVDGVELMSL